MNDRAYIFNKLKKNSLISENYMGEYTQASYPDVIDQFIKMVEAVGGQTEMVVQDKDGASHANDDQVDMPGTSYVVQGEFGVAENGAIWIEPAEDRSRSDIFLAEELIIDLPANEIVPTMHEAYERLEGRDFGYGTFISGPSKTADIEQSLVIGAQGPKSCLVRLIKK